MKREYTNAVPNIGKSDKNKLTSVLDEFAKREEGVMILTPDPGEYVSVYSMVNSLKGAIKKSGYPMEAFTSNGKGYVKKLI